MRPFYGCKYLHFYLSEFAATLFHDYQLNFRNTRQLPLITIWNLKMLTNFFVRTTNRYSAYKILAVIDSHKLIPTKVSKQCRLTKKKLSPVSTRSFSSSLIYVSMTNLKQTKIWLKTVTVIIIGVRFPCAIQHLNCKF